MSEPAVKATLPADEIPARSVKLIEPFVAVTVVSPVEEVSSEAALTSCEAASVTVVPVTGEAPVTPIV